MAEIAQQFAVHYMTVSRAVRERELGDEENVGMLELTPGTLNPWNREPAGADWRYTAKSSGKSEMSFRRLPSTITASMSAASDMPNAATVACSSYRAK